MSKIEHIGQYESGRSYKKVLFWFIFILVVVCLGTLYFILSKATIVLYPKTISKELELEVLLDAKANNVDLSKNLIHGIILNKENELTKDFNDVPPKKIEENAIGKITIHNGYDRALGFKKGDILSVLEDIPGTQPLQKIELTQDFIVYRHQTKTVEAQAVTKGVTGHIPPSKFKFEKFDDFMNGKLTVSSEEIFKGGVRTANLVTADDIAMSKNQLVNEISQTNLGEIKESLREGEVLNKNNAVNNITHFSLNITPPQETKSYQLNLGVKTVAAVFKKDDLVDLLNEKLKEKTDNDEEFLKFNPDSLSFAIDKFDLDNQTATLKIKISGNFKSKLSTKLFNKDEIKGYNKRAVLAYYSQFGELDNIEVNFWPNFRKTVPEMDSRIIIEVKE